MQNYIIPNYVSQYQARSAMLDFSNLDFKPHAHAKGVQARLDLGNGLEISVVANNGDGEGLYGNVSDELYEVAIFNDDGMIPLSPSDDVVGWQSPDQISHLMAKAQVEGSVWIDDLKEAKSEFRRELGLD
jgi:hypothetical protein